MPWEDVNAAFGGVVLCSDLALEDVLFRGIDPSFGVRRIMDDLGRYRMGWTHDAYENFNCTSLISLE